jgi:hypothetical protein
MGARINDIDLESLIREGSGNRAFRFPRSKKPLTDFLRQQQFARKVKMTLFAFYDPVKDVGLQQDLLLVKSFGTWGKR